MGKLEIDAFYHLINIDLSHLQHVNYVGIINMTSSRPKPHSHPNALLLVVMDLDHRKNQRQGPETLH